MREYNQRPEVKARNKERMRIYHKEYNQRPEIKKRKREYMREYTKRPKVKEYYKEYNQRPEVKERVRKYYSVYNRKNRKAHRMQFFEMYGAECACCGETDKRFLTLDHINDDGNTHRKKRNSEGILFDAISKFAPEEYQVLCFNCNYGRAINHGVCPHSPHEPEISIWDSTPFMTKGKRQRRNLRKRLFDVYGEVCSCCGETNKRFLTFDHKLNNGSFERKMVGGDKSLKIWRNALRNPDPNKYQILCFNCNCGRAINGGICPHKDE